MTIPRIQEAVSQRFGVTLDELVSPRRSQAVAYPRQVAMYLSRELTDASLPMIGKEFGGRDHTTVIHAKDKITTADPRGSLCVQPCARVDRAHQAGALMLGVHVRAVTTPVDCVGRANTPVHTRFPRS